MMFLNYFRLLFILQFSLIYICHCTYHDDFLILSPKKEYSGKYVKFNRLVEMTSKVPWEDPLKESAKIALNNSKDSLLRASYIGMRNIDPPTYGDIVILAKGKLKKFSNDSYSFEEIHDACEYECQNNADRYLENVDALWMVERIRHRENARGYRYDLRFTIVPIESGKNNGSRSNNLEERLRNQLKKTFILRDSDYPKYFQYIAPKTSVIRRSDNLDRSLTTIINQNHLQQHNVYGYLQAPKQYQVNNGRLNTGEYYMKQYSMPKPIPMNSYYIPNQRYPVRFPDSRESINVVKNPYQLNPMKHEERQETSVHNAVSFVDHRGALDLNNNNNKPSIQSNNGNIAQQSKPHPGRSTNLFIPQPAIALPIIVPQMSLLPYTVPLHLQVSTPSNQILYAQQPDITTFRYPVHPYLNSQQQKQQPKHQSIPPFQYLQINNKTDNSNKFKESELLKSQAFSLPDPIYHSTSTTPIYPTQYTPKLSNYVTASSIQINSYDNSNDFQPINSPYLVPSKNTSSKKSTFSSDKYNDSTTEKSKLSNFRNRQSLKDKIPKTTTTTTTQSPPLTTSNTTEFPRNHQFSLNDESNYDVVVTRPSATKRTTEKPILKWLPKKQQRNKTLSNVTSYSTITKSTSQSPLSIETSLSNQSNIHPTKASTHTQVFRGRNRFYNSKRNSTTSTVTTEKSTLLSSIPSQTLKLLRRKATTTLLPITTQQSPSSFITTSSPTVFPTHAYDITSFEVNDPTMQSYSYSTSISLLIDDDEKSGTTSSYELIPAGVEKIKSNSSNIQIYKASVESEIDLDVKDNARIGQIEKSIINP